MLKYIYPFLTNLKCCNLIYPILTNPENRKQKLKYGNSEKLSAGVEDLGSRG